MAPSVPAGFVVRGLGLWGVLGVGHVRFVGCMRGLAGFVCGHCMGLSVCILGCVVLSSVAEGLCGGLVCVCGGGFLHFLGFSVRMGSLFGESRLRRIVAGLRYFGSLRGIWVRSGSFCGL